MVFKTERLLVKPIAEVHRKEFVELLTAEEIISAIPQKKTSKENIEIKFQIALSFDGNIGENSISLLGIFEQNKNELIGLAGFLTNNKKDRELGYRFRKSFWGKGYATEAAKKVKESVSTYQEQGSDKRVSSPQNLKTMERAMKAYRAAKAKQ